MPPIHILDIEPDGNGGAWVRWYDEANLDGLPLEALFHLTPEKLHDLGAVYEKIGDPSGPEFRRIGRRLDPDDDSEPTVEITGLADQDVSDFRSAYEALLTNLIDRSQRGINSRAPHWVLEGARNGEPVPAQYRSARARRPDDEAFGRIRGRAPEYPPGLGPGGPPGRGIP